MEEVRLQPLSDREKRKIRQEVEENLSVQQLLPDPVNIMVANQNFTIVSFISPVSGTVPSQWGEVEKFLTKKKFSKIARIQLMKLIAENYLMMMKVRGSFRTLEEAQAWCENRIGTAEGIETHVINNYEFGFIPPNKYISNNSPEVEKTYADKKANDFYRKRRVEQETQRLNFQRRMEIFRENTKKNNEAYKALSEEEKAELNQKREKTKAEIKGVPIEDILQDEKMQKLITQDSFQTVKDISQHLGIDQDRLFQAWAKLDAQKKSKKQEEEQLRIEVLEKKKTSTGIEDWDNRIEEVD